MNFLIERFNTKKMRYFCFTITFIYSVFDKKHGYFDNNHYKILTMNCFNTEMN